MPTTLLAIDTATEVCSVALARGEDVRERAEAVGQRHSERILPMVEALLRETGLRLQECDAIAFGSGPGAFTGLRIACGIAQGLAFARDLPACGVSTLEALAEESGARRAVACLDARMGEVYYCALERQDGRWREVIPAQCVAPERAPRPPGAGWVGCGSGVAAYGDMGFDRVYPEIHPGAAAVARLAAPRLAAGEGVDAACIAPVYLRDKVALTTEERRNR